MTVSDTVCPIGRLSLLLVCILGSVSEVLTLLCFVVVVTNPEDPNFDLEKLISKWEKDS